ncbi:MAG: nicotinate phosphoribosyltransferase [Woeseiaceae bacterium]|nr:nicotinate phosphoribosyltransferase [Woeseiaceae bacterium]
MPRRFISAADLGLLTDLYELTMLQAYHACGMRSNATFSLHFRKLPPHRRFMLACGQQHAAHLVTGLHFPRDALDKLSGIGLFNDTFLRWLEAFRFSGDIVAMPEGTPVFPHEPLLEVTAPVAEAQLLETILMNLVHLETVLASKASRLVLAAAGRPVMDFGMRRMHGIDAAVHGVRAFRTAGIAQTSNVLAGLEFGLPVGGTMAHSFIQAHANEMDAFRTYAELYPDTTLLVDTFDTMGGVDKVIGLSRELGENFRVGAIRLDSGDLGALATEARKRLDAAGLKAVRIVASGGLDEHEIATLMAGGAPIDAFGVGTSLGTSADSPNLDLVYKLTSYDDSPRLKDSPGKAIFPGDKQVYRFYDASGRCTHDEITLRHEKRDAEALLLPIVANGEAIGSDTLDPEVAANHASQALKNLPADLSRLDDGGTGYDVRISDAVTRLRDKALADLRGQDLPDQG